MNTYIANNLEFKTLLLAKLIEESMEIKLAKTSQDMSEEIADVYEVLETIISEY